MKLTIILDQEATDALKERVEGYNTGSGQPAITPEQFMEKVHCAPFIDSLVATKRALTAEQLKAAADVLPYEKRVELAKLNRSFITANS